MAATSQEAAPNSARNSALDWRSKGVACGRRRGKAFAGRVALWRAVCDARFLWLTKTLAPYDRIVQPFSSDAGLHSLRYALCFRSLYTTVPCFASTAAQGVFIDLVLVIGCKA